MKKADVTIICEAKVAQQIISLLDTKVTRSERFDYFGHTKLVTRRYREDIWNPDTIRTANNCSVYEFYWPSMNWDTRFNFPRQLENILSQAEKRSESGYHFVVMKYDPYDHVELWRHISDDHLDHIWVSLDCTDELCFDREGAMAC